MKMKILGISASLRNIRQGIGSDNWINELRQIKSYEHLLEYLKRQAQFGLGAFIEAGRKDGKPFDEIYKNLKKISRKHGMSNSEIMLTAGLWGAITSGADIEHITLADYFGDMKKGKKSHDILIEKVKKADGLLVSGPVYFGDRSSLTHDFIQVLRKNQSVVRNKLFAGMAVGAKRNGGQETCLVYQMIDFVNLGMFAVGNDADTTAQYGGTGHAGEIGSGADDEYGIKTSVGAGRRIAQVLNLKEHGRIAKLKDRPRVGIFVLQDVDKQAKALTEDYILNSRFSEKADFKFFYFPKELVRRCIACDMCPQTIGKDEIYRCIIKNNTDLFAKFHKEIIDLDAILLGGYSPVEYDRLESIYQSFMERTRYLRRSDYVFSNCLVAPFVIQEIGSRENLQTRIHTSIIRHHTIMHRPVIFHVDGGKILQLEKSLETLDSFLDAVAEMTAGRIIYMCSEDSYSNYLPFGYTLSSERDRVPKTLIKRKENIANRKEKFRRMRENRLSI